MAVPTVEITAITSTLLATQQGTWPGDFVPGPLRDQKAGPRSPGEIALRTDCYHQEQGRDRSHTPASSLRLQAVRRAAARRLR